MKINRNMSAVRANKQLLGTENRLSKSMKGFKRLQDKFSRGQSGRNGYLQQDEGADRSA